MRATPLVAGLLSGLLLAGCGWKGPKELQTFSTVDEDLAEGVIALDKAAWKLVAIQTMDRARTSDGRLQVRVELANLSDQDLPVQVQTLFRDKAGMPSGEDTPFEVVVIPGMGSKLYTVTSLKPDAESFTIQVKTP